LGPAAHGANRARGHHAGPGPRARLHVCAELGTVVLTRLAPCVLMAACRRWSSARSSTRGWWQWQSPPTATSQRGGRRRGVGGGCWQWFRLRVAVGIDDKDRPGAGDVERNGMARRRISSCHSACTTVHRSAEEARVVGGLISGPDVARFNQYDQARSRRSVGRWVQEE